jgi:hypothetical protein
MQDSVRRVSVARFVTVADLLDQAFPKANATPDYLSHECERAEQSLLTAIGKTASTGDPVLARLLALTHREEA